jgi:diaminopimelate epimerase
VYPAETMTLAPDIAGTPFVKMHGAQNHFVIVDARTTPFAPSKSDIAEICNPATGIGADELIVIEPSTSEAAAFMRIFNGDGREVEACGNATRCVAWMLCEEKGVEELVIQTLAGDLECRRVGEEQISATMGKVRMDWQSVPLSRPSDNLHLDLNSGALSDPVALNVGNPHVVFFVDDLDEIDVTAVAIPIQENDLFPDGVNVGVAQVLGPRRMRLVVYERGAGLTMACGSGACAAVFAAQQRHLTESPAMQVELPGGTVSIEIRDDDTAVMTGPIAYCIDGTL